MTIDNNEKADSLPELGTKAGDHIAAILKSISGAVPIVGSALAEIINYTIPNQRNDRVCLYLSLLAKRLESLELSNAKEILSKPENIDLFEDGANQAVRAISSERVQFIANAVSTGIGDNEKEKIYHKRTLNILGQLDDEEILILHAYASRSTEEFERLMPEPAVLGSTQEVIDRNAMWDAAKDKLKNLSLIKFSQRANKIEVPERGNRTKQVYIQEVDLFGRRQGTTDITALGVMLLKCIGFKDL